MTKMFESVMLIEQTIEKIKDRLKRQLEISDQEFKLAFEQDPSVPENYTDKDNSLYQEWILSTHRKNLEDMIDLIYSTLKWHYLYRNKLKEEDKNIYIFDNIHHLKDELEKYPWYNKYETPLSKKEVEEDIKEKEVIKYETNNYKIFIPLTERQAIKYGKGTKWCTQQKKHSNNQFHQYFKDGLLWYIIGKTEEYRGKKYQIHIEKREVRDIIDRPIFMWEFFNSNPEIERVIIDHTKKIPGGEYKIEEYIYHILNEILKPPETEDFFDYNIEQLAEEEPEYIREYIVENIPFKPEVKNLINTKPDRYVVELHPLLAQFYEELSPEAEKRFVTSADEVQRELRHNTIFSPYIILKGGENILSKNTYLKIVKIHPLNIIDIISQGIEPHEDVQLEQLNAAIKLNKPHLIPKIIENLINQGIEPPENVQLKQIKNVDGQAIETILRLLLSLKKPLSEKVKIQQIETGIQGINYLLKHVKLNRNELLQQIKWQKETKNEKDLINMFNYFNVELSDNLKKQLGISEAYNIMGIDI